MAILNRFNKKNKINVKKLPLILITLLILTNLSAQKPIDTTNEFTIEGLVEKTLVINTDSLKNRPTIKIDSIIITNHLGERKSVLRNLAVIPIKDFLSKAVIKVESPKKLSEFYFAFVAVDGYKVVFSWNEIFNNKLGQEIYIIAEKDGQEIESLNDRISIFSRTDLMTGKRYVKGGFVA